MKTSKLFLKIILLSTVLSAPFAAFAQARLGNTIDHVAYSMSISEDGNRLAVGWMDPTNCLYPHAYPRVDMYEWTGTVAGWQKLGSSPEFYASDGEYGTVNVSLSGDGQRVAINSTFEHDGLTIAGTTRIFEWTGSGWEQMGADFFNEGTELSLSYDGSRLAIGFPAFQYFSEGTAAVYEWNGTSWEQLGPTFEGTEQYENLGRLSLSNDGSRLALCSGYLSHNLLDGFSQVFEWNGADWEVMNANGALIELSERFTISGNGSHGINFFPNQTERYDWNGDNWEQTAVIEGKNGAISYDGNRLAINDATIYEWQGEDWAELNPALFTDPPYPGYVPILAISGNGNRVAVGGHTSISVYDLELNGFIYELPSVCSNANPQTFSNVFYPTGGTISGPGVMPGSEEGQMTFDPAALSSGTHMITYTVDGEEYTTPITIINPLPPSFSFADTLVVTETGLVNIPGTALPEGGIYTDNQGLVEDDGNGLTFSLNALEATTTTTITYSATDENGCAASASQVVVLVNQSPNGGHPYPHQLGADIRSEGLAGLFGSSLSLSGDGRRIAVGAYAQGPGEVHVYEYGDMGWERMGDGIVGQDFGDHFGYDVELSADGNRLLVSMPYNRTYDECGYYINADCELYEWDGTNWNRLAYNFLSGFGSGPSFGEAIAMAGDGSRCIVGFPRLINNHPGRVYLYSDSGTGLLVDNILYADDGYGGFGQALALSGNGNRLIVGEPNANNGGKIHIYNWEDDVPYTIAGNSLGDQFGYSVIITDDGNRIAIGAPQRDQADNLPGYVRIYDRVDDSWVQRGTDIVGSFPGEQFGTSIAFSLNGSRIVVGAPGSENSAVNAGRAALFEWNGSDWIELEQILAGGDQAEDQFGVSVAGTTFSDVIAIGAPQENTLLSRGYVRVFGSEEAVFQNVFDAMCVNAEPVSLSGGIPLGGIYSGAGVSDNGDGFTFDFDPLAAGEGQIVITYTIDTSVVTNLIEVTPLPELSLGLPDTVFVMPGTPLTINGNGMPVGGIYSSDSGSFVDNGDGLTFDFVDTIELETIQTIHYTYWDEQGCENAISGMLTLIDLSVHVVDLQELGITVFPNPTNGRLTIKGENIQTMQLLDSNGALCWKQEEVTSPLDFSNLPAGGYYLLVQLTNGQKGGQLIIKK